MTASFFASQAGGISVRMEWFDNKSLHEGKEIPIPTLQGWWADKLSKAKAWEKDSNGVSPDYPERCDVLAEQTRTIFHEDRHGRQSIRGGTSDIDANAVDWAKQVAVAFSSLDEWTLIPSKD